MSTDFRLHDLHTVSLVDPATGNITWTGAVHQFLDDNEFDADQREDIHAELSVNGVYRGGGGAAPIWELYDRLLTPAAPTPKVRVREWSGSPDPSDPDNFWIDDETGERRAA